MDRSQIRSEIFTFLKDYRARSARSQGIVSMQSIQFNTIIGHFQNKFGTQDQNGRPNNFNDVFDVIHEMISNHIFSPDAGGPNASQFYPFLRVTDFGWECIESEDWLPYDPEGYIKEVKSRIPNIDQVVLRYLTEAIVAFNKELPLSSTFALGAASEKMILQLIESLGNAIKSASDKAKYFKSIQDKGIAAKYKKFRDEWELRKVTTVLSLDREVDNQIDGIFHFIKQNRNQAGHPTGGQYNKKALMANLQMFVEYGKSIQNVISYLTPGSLK